MKRLLLLLLLCATGWSSYAQALRLTFPKNGAVFQRNLSKRGTISILGSFNSRNFLNGSYRLRATLRKLNVRTGQVLQPEQATTRTLTSSGSLFSGQIQIDEGWYELRVQNFNSSNVPIGAPAIQKVGVGEVFIIAGQSNAQGLPDEVAQNAYPAGRATPSMDGVRVQPNARLTPQEYGVFATNPTNQELQARMELKPDITSLASVANNQAKIAPFGNSLWYWAAVGEKIADRYNVPVAFFNAAWGGTFITPYFLSTNPNYPPLGVPTADNTPYPRGSPYGAIRNTLLYYGSVYGVRAILWHQGETDTEALVSANEQGWRTPIPRPDIGINVTERRAVTSSQDYTNKLNAVIAQSRQDFQTNDGSVLPWVVAQASFRANSTSQVVLSGQAGVVNFANKVYPGPNTDNVVPPSQRRQTDGGYGPEPVHFQGLGLVNAAQAWFDALPGVIEQVAPVTPQSLGTEPQTLALSANEGSIIAPAGTRYEWVSESGDRTDPNTVVSTQQSVPANGASWTGRAFVVNSLGNLVMTQAVTMPYTIVNDTQPSGGLASGSCYTIQVQKTGLQLQDMGDGFVKQQGSNGQNNQIWKAEDAGGSQFRFTTQTGSNQVIKADNGENVGEQLTLGGYNGDDRQKWAVQQDGTTGNYRIYRSNGLTWDLNNYGNSPELQIYGNTSEPFYDYRSFRFNATTCPTGGGTTPPSGGFAVSAPTYDCNTGNLTINTTGGNGNTIEYRVAGLQDWSTNNLIPVPSHQRNGTNFTLQARQSGAEVSLGYTTTCNGGTPPSPSGFAISGGTLDCGSGNLSINTTGGNGTTIEYRVAGLQDWGTGNVLSVPSHQRNGTNFTLQARQSGTEVSYSYGTTCAGYRLAAPGSLNQETATDALVLAPNPSKGTVRVRFRLAKQEKATLSVVSLSGQTLQRQAVVGTGSEQTEVMELKQETAGMYLIRLQTAQGVLRTGKLVLER